QAPIGLAPPAATETALVYPEGNVAANPAPGTRHATYRQPKRAPERLRPQRPRSPVRSSTHPLPILELHHHFQNPFRVARRPPPILRTFPFGRSGPQNPQPLWSAFALFADGPSMPRCPKGVPAGNPHMAICLRTILLAPPCRWNPKREKPLHTEPPG